MVTYDWAGAAPGPWVSLAVVMSTQRTRLAAYALCVDTGRILLCRVAPGYPAAGVWTLPGGGVSFTEDPIDAALRELTEETGLVGQVDRLALVNSISGPASPELGRDAWHGVRVVYHVTITGGRLRDEVDESSDRAEWAPLSQLQARPISELVRVAVDALGGEGEPGR